jgi:hypothetical protein
LLETGTVLGVRGVQHRHTAPGDVTALSVVSSVAVDGDNCVAVRAERRVLT